MALYDYDSYGRYIAGFTVLAGIFVLPLSILWFVSFCLARRRRDPARVGIAWMKAVFPTWNLSLMLYTVKGGLQAWTWFDDFTSSESRALNQIISHLGSVAGFLNYVASIFLFITLVELAGGYLLCLKGGGEPSPIRRFARIAVLAWSFVLLVLVIAEFGLNESYITRFSRVTTLNRDSYYSASLTLLRLDSANYILFWLTTLPILGYCAFVVHKTRALEQLRSGAILVLVCAALNFVRQIITMAINIHANLINIAAAITTGSDESLAVGWIVSPFFDFVPMFVILVILFSLAIRKHKGLWSQEQPDWVYPAVMYVPAVYPPGQMQGGMVPVQQQPYMQQQQPQQQQPMQPTQGLPAYLQVAQQKQMQQQHQGQPAPAQ